MQPGHLRAQAGTRLFDRLLQIRVIDVRVGGMIGPGRAFIRWMGRFLSAFVFFLGYLWGIANDVAWQLDSI